MRVAVRADASPRIGAGHLMRCLSLADALRARGAQIAFVTGPLPEALAARVRGAGHRLAEIEPAGLVPDRPDWDRAPADAAAQAADAARTRAALGAFVPDWVVVDHYRLDAEWERGLLETGPCRILAIDDLANRRHECAILVDQTFGRAAEDYLPLVPEGTTVFAGARYALLRPEFARARAEALRRRRTSRPVERLLVSFGATDIGSVTAKVLGAAVAAGISCPIDAVIGPGAPSLAEVAALARRHKQIALHVDTSNMAELIANADLAIATAGVSSWERCCLGLPTVLLTLARNQELVARNLEGVGAAVVVTRWEDAVPVAEQLLTDVEARARMSAAAAAITDGEGAGIVARLLTGFVPSGAGPLRLREATDADSERIWLWRNDPLMRAMAKSSDPIPWHVHDHWFGAALASAETELLIGESGGEPVGMIRFDAVEGGAYLVSINVAPARRGHGIGAALLREGCRVFGLRHPDCSLEAEIRRGNTASERIFTGCGFVPTGEIAGSDHARYVRPTAADAVRSG